MIYYNLADKYKYDRNTFSRKSKKNHNKYSITCVCRVCGKEFTTDRAYKNLDYICEDCQKALKKLDSEANKGR